MAQENAEACWEESVCHHAYYNQTLYTCSQPFSLLAHVVLSLLFFVFDLGERVIERNVKDLRLLGKGSAVTQSLVPLVVSVDWIPLACCWSMGTLI